MKKYLRIYNIIFPIYFILFTPPIIFIMLAGNFIIDAIVVCVVLWACKSLNTIQNKWKYITKVWLFGFVADILAALLMLCLEFLDIIYSYVPWRSASNLIVMVLVVCVGGVLIGYFNYRLACRAGLPKHVAFRQALFMGIITAPWMFLMPSFSF